MTCTKEKEALAMSVLDAILMGIIQGITEFLPVSSFGHLCAAGNMLGTERAAGVLFEAMLHLGTLAALVLVLQKDIRRIGVELIGMFMDLIGNVNLFFHNKRTGENLHYARIVHGTYRKFTALLLVSSIPTAIIGYTARRLVAMTAASKLMPGIGILITGIVLLVVDFGKSGGQKTPREAGYDHAMWIGICQGISVFPGLSRCGLTVSAALLCGFSRKFAVRYSYILSIPAIVGAFFVEIGEFASPKMSVGLGFTYLLGMLVAAAVGYFAVKFLLRLLQSAKLRFFAFYCFFAGAVALAGSFM